MRGRYTVLVLLVIFNTYNGKTQGLRIGEIAPDFTTHWVENADYPVTTTEDKAVVLEFWFTSCGPCIFSIPHLNELSAQYDTSQVAFVSISFDSESQILKFLEDKKYLAMTGSDTARSIIDRYQVSGYPQTFLIDRGGRIRWQGYPLQLKKEMIDILIGEERYNQIISTKINEDLPPVEIKTNSYRFDINENNYAEGSGYSLNAAEVSFANYTLSDIYRIVYKIPGNRVALDDSLSNQRYDVYLKNPDGENVQETLALMADFIADRMNLSAEWVKTQTETYTIRIRDLEQFITEAVDTSRVYSGLGTTIMRDNRWIGSGASFEDLAHQLEHTFGTVFIDETRQAGRFEFEFSMNELDDALQHLESKYGLHFTRSETEIPILRIQKR